MLVNFDFSELILMIICLRVILWSVMLLLLFSVWFGLVFIVGFIELVNDDCINDWKWNMNIVCKLLIGLCFLLL